jgi:hypothetical protein
MPFLSGAGMEYVMGRGWLYTHWIVRVEHVSILSKLIETLNTKHFFKFRVEYGGQKLQ